MSVQGVLQSDSSKVLKPSRDVIHPSHMVVHLQADMLTLAVLTETHPKRNNLLPVQRRFSLHMLLLTLAAILKTSLHIQHQYQYQEKFDFNNHNNVK